MTCGWHSPAGAAGAGAAAAAGACLRRQRRREVRASPLCLPGTQHFRCIGRRLPSLPASESVGWVHAARQGRRRRRGVRQNRERSARFCAHSPILRAVFILKHFLLKKALSAIDSQTDRRSDHCVAGLRGRTRPRGRTESGDFVHAEVSSSMFYGVLCSDLGLNKFCAIIEILSKITFQD